ncbi:MAG: AAA family ATPase [Chloroflexota bacterium]
MRRTNGYYVDKTHYIPLIEAASFYLFCIRPRRAGKSFLLSMLQHYCDVNEADNFEALFGKTYIGQNPTQDRNSYLVLFFNFAMISSLPEQLQSSFEENINNEIDDFLTRFTIAIYRKLPGAF